MDIWNQMVKSFRKEELEIAGVILWNIWQARNNCLHTGIAADINKICRSILIHLDELGLGDKPLVFCPPMENQPSLACWKPPNQGLRKLNTDAS